jgi:hypothetical protein
MDPNVTKAGGSSMDVANFAPSSAFGAPQNVGAQYVTANQLPNGQPAAGPALAQDYQQASTTSRSMQSTSFDNTVVINTTVSMVAGDTDLIEKEWVIKAKVIVENTRHDPYIQNQQLGLLKTDYMVKRYGKKLNPDEPNV